MSSTAVASPLLPSNHYDYDISSYRNMTTSPSQPPKPHNKPNRARNQNNHNQANSNSNSNSNSHSHSNHQYAMSDSNLPPQAQTPRPKKHRPKQNDNHRAASGSDIPKASRSKAMPVNKSPTMATPAKAAYAGPTFHASPAASALPMPKFMSKSVPPATSDNSLQAKLESDPNNANAPSPAPETAVPAAPLVREKSPLDIFFNADRNERAGKSASPSLARRITPPESKGLFTMDMDASNSPRMARSPAVPSPARPVTQQEEADNRAHTQSLKDFLKLNQQQPSNPSPARPANQSYTTPQQQRTLDQDPSVIYGNRNLSPLFHAARNPSPYSTPQRETAAQSRQPFDPRAFIESQTAQQSQQSPFITSSPHQSFPPVHHQQQQQQQQQPSPYRVNSYEHHHNMNGTPTSLRHQQQPPEQSPNVKDMEAKLRGMLKLC